MGIEPVTLYQADKDSRKEWEDTYIKGLDLLGLKIEERTQPWEGACGVYHPLLSETLVRFQAETIMETFPAMGPVKTVIIGKETPEKKAAAERVGDDMNYQLTEKMPEYRPEHERMLWGLGLSGNAFKKVYYDPSLGRQVSMFVPAEDLVVPYGASDLASAARVTHVMRKTRVVAVHAHRGAVGEADFQAAQQSAGIPGHGRWTILSLNGEGVAPPTQQVFQISSGLPDRA